jgi:hypothetical protein
MAQADIDAAIQATAAMSTPIMNALTGFIGTLLTGIIGSAIIAAFVKAPARTPGAPARV